MIRSILSIIKQLGICGIIKSVYFNLRYLPLSQAISIPILVDNRIKISKMHRGGVIFDSKVHFGIVRFGLLDKQYHGNQYGNLLIDGTLLIIGSGYHQFGVGIRLTIDKGAVLEIGDNFTVSANTKFSVSNHITVGDGNMWSYDNVIMDTDRHQITNKNGEILNYNRPVVFGNHIWMGCRNVILKGTEIADGCVIASGSDVRGKYMESNCIISSNGKILKHNIRWKRDWAVNSLQ